jgi:isoquinoline 1-oxidoreductase beta subunit
MRTRTRETIPSSPNTIADEAQQGCQGQIFKVDRRKFVQAGAAAGLTLGFTPHVLARLNTASAATDAAQAFEPAAYIRIDPSGTTLILHRSEMGQGARTSVAMLLAEELELPWEEIRVEQAVGDPRYGNQNTDGSTTVRLNWQPLREAGAAARIMLTQAAAQAWGVAADQCRAEAGRISHPGSGKSAGYGELAAAAAALDVPEKPALKAKEEHKILGTPRALIDVPDIVRGKARYGIDVVQPGMLYASVERCPTIRGTLASFDAKAALAVPGVKKVLALEGAPQPFNLNAGVAVVGTNTFATLKGRKALQIEWKNAEGLESSDEFRAKLQQLVDGEGKGFRSEGDFKAAKAAAAKTLSATFHGPHLVHAPMEPLSATAVVTDAGCEIWAPTQDPMTARQRVAETLGLEMDQVTVHVTLLGGGFGRKSKPDFILEAAKVAKEMPGTPIKLTWTREDEVQHGFYRAQNAQKVEATLDAAGKVTGWRHHTAFPTILSTFMPGATNPSPFELGMGLTNLPYRIPAIQLESSGIASDVRIGWLRSVCNTFHAHAVNCFVDEIAETVGTDPVQWRLENLGEARQLDFSERDKPYGQDTGRLAHVIERCAEVSRWGKKKVANGVARGFASHFSFLTYVAAALDASLDADGKVKVHEVDLVVDCGTVVNPDTVRAQLEGAVVFALSMALYGEITVKDGVVQQSNFHDYPMLRIGQMPKVNVEIIDSDAPPSGIGEPGVPPIAPALVNAIAKLTGKRIYDLPLSKAGLA